MDNVLPFDHQGLTVSLARSNVGYASVRLCEWDSRGVSFAVQRYSNCYYWQIFHCNCRNKANLYGSSCIRRLDVSQKMYNGKKTYTRLQPSRNAFHLLGTTHSKECSRSKQLSSSASKRPSISPHSCSNSMCETKNAFDLRPAVATNLADCICAQYVIH